MRPLHFLAGILAGGGLIALTRHLLDKEYIQVRKPSALLAAMPLLGVTLLGFLFEVAEYSLERFSFSHLRILGSPYADIEGQLFNILGAAVAVKIYFLYNKRMNNKTWVWLSSIIGIALIGLAFFYWLTPAGSLPHLLPGFIAGSTTIHFKHGLGAFILGLGAFAFAWFKGGKKSATG